MVKNKRITDVALIALFAAVIGVCSIISIPIPGSVSLTLQTFAVALCGCFFGSKRGLIAVAVYLFCGICGVPIFSGFACGFGVLVGKTGGFLIGFFFLCAACGLAQKYQSWFIRLLFFVGGLFLCHLLGVLQFSFVTSTKIWQSFLWVSLPFIIKDILSIVLADFIAVKVKKQIGKNNPTE